MCITLIYTLGSNNSFGSVSIIKSIYVRIIINIMIIIFILFIQVSQILMAFAPFTLPLPWSAIFITIQVIIQIFRFESCKTVMADAHWESSIAYAITFVCMVFLILRYVLYELNSKKLFKDNQMLLASTDEKILFVDFLCKEMKIPLQLISGTIEHFEYVDLKVLSRDGLLVAQQMLCYSHEIVRNCHYLVMFLFVFIGFVLELYNMLLLFVCVIEFVMDL